MTTSIDRERADYFQQLSQRAIDQMAQLCALGRETADHPPAGNPCGDDLDQAYLKRIEAISAGEGAGLSPWQVAQARELMFWRSVAFHGYDGKHPLMFPLLQEHFMVSTFYRTGWARAEFRTATICEIGCGPLGMIEYLPGARQVAFDSLNDEYARLFAKFRNPAIDYISNHQQFMLDTTLADLAICHNTLDHCERPAVLFEALFGKLRVGGRFIFQVNLSRPGFSQTAEYRKFHPSPLTFEQVMGWLAAKSEEFEHVYSSEPTTADNEFYFLSWGKKTRDEPVSYLQPTIAVTNGAATGISAAAATRTVEDRPAAGASPRALTSSFTLGTEAKGDTEPFVNLPMIAEVASEEALQAQARSEFGLIEAIAGYRTRDTAPIPSIAQREGYYGPSHTGYWLSGLSDALLVAKRAARLGLGAKARYFELGCASGRVVRHLAFHTDVPITCCDLNKRHTEWVRLFLPERINVFHSSLTPHLPLDDNSIDIATAFSVFTHIDDFEIAWLLELRRILRPGGLAYITVATDHTWERYKNHRISEHLLPLADRITDYRVDERLLAGRMPREKTVFWRHGDREVHAAMVFHHAAYIRREWGRLFDVINIIPDGHFHQDVVLLRK